MRLFRLLSRVAFICNICFLLTAFVLWLPNPPEGNLISTIIVLGYFLAIVINVLLNLSLLILFALGKLSAPRIPIWLLIVNFLFFIIQSILIIISTQQ
jgi:hypothetical protein